MWCPNCGSEYRQGYTHCSDCGDELVHESPEAPEPTREVQARPPFDPHSIGPELVEIGTYGGQFEGEMIRSLLRGNGIESMMTGDGTAYGEAYPMTVGPFSIVKVLVRPADAERAREVVRAANTGDLVEDEAEGDDV